MVQTVEEHLYARAMAAETQEDADQVFHEFQLLFRGLTDEELRSSIAYYAGYYNDKVRERVERLFKCEHPLFGSIAEMSQPTPEESIELGRRLADTGVIWTLKQLREERNGVS